MGYKENAVTVPLDKRITTMKITNAWLVDWAEAGPQTEYRHPEDGSLRIRNPHPELILCAEMTHLQLAGEE